MIKICMSVTPHALDPPPPVTNWPTFSDPSPLECDVLYGRPLIIYIFLFYTTVRLRLFGYYLCGLPLEEFNGFVWMELTDSHVWDELVASVSYLKERKVLHTVA